MFKNVLATVLTAAMLLSCNTAKLQKLGDLLNNSPVQIKVPTQLSADEIGRGLKEALQSGVNKGADRLSAVDGYYKSAYKILLPPEARQVADRLRSVPGFSGFEESVVEKINRGAEDAAKSAKPIFVNAITSMSISDAMGILRGEPDAATQYLRRVTYDQLYQAFNPVIVESLDKFGAREYWANGINAYNRIPLVKQANPDLDDYVTRQALEGLFDMIKLEEANIRSNVSARTSDLLRRVFAQQGK
jgi:hypothetical protein